MSKSPPIFRSESRVLGLDTCDPDIIIGSILRGGLFLDGVLTFSADLRTNQLASKINTTKYRPELRAIMIHDPSMILNSSTVERMTGLPVLETVAAVKGRPTSQRGLSKVTGQKRSMMHSRPPTIDQIAAAKAIRGGLAEPVRIAHLLSKLHVFGRFLQEKR